MIFTRYKNSQFFLPDHSNVAALYINKAYKNNTIDLADILGQLFLCIFFYDGITDNQLNTAQPLLDQVVKEGRGLVWLQDKDDKIDIGGRPTIGIDKDKHCSLGIDLDNNILFEIKDAGRLLLVETNADSFLFTVKNSIAIAINAGYSLEFAEFSIPVSGTDIGAVKVNKITGPLSNRLQPVSSFINNKNRILDIEYFSQDSFNKIDQQELYYFPYPKANLVEGKAFQSYIKHNSANGVATNILDEKGVQLKVNGDFISKLSIIEYKVGVKTYTYHRFIPVGEFNYSIDGESNDRTTVLLGYSGTERINLPSKGKFKFISRDQIKVDDHNENLVVSERSLSSGLSFGKEEVYYLDSEKKSLFENGVAPSFNNDSNWQVFYTPIAIKSIVKDRPVPIIPTLLHKTKNNLLQLENVFTKVRLRDSTKALPDSELLNKTSKFITPQGFLREDNLLNFISRSTATAKDNTTTKFEFSVDGVTITSDFYLSLCKEDVFFVLTPEMIKAQAAVSINVNFKIGDFIVELKEFNKPGEFPVLKNDTYVIFKFSRHSFTDLLKDYTKWSNFGSYKPSAAEAAKLISGINSKIKFPENADYEYFNKIIAKDSNWNGVVVINIPISDRKNLPPIFDGLSGSQDLTEYPKPAPVSGEGEILKLTTGLKFQYVAFPVNKTAIRNDGTIGIDSTSFYGLIDYDLLNKIDTSHSDDYKLVSAHFPAKKDDIKTYKFVLSKLLVRFENSGIRNFKSFAFLQVPYLFDNKVQFGTFPLSHPGMPDGDIKPNFIRLEGQYQKNSAGKDEFNFAAQSRITITFEEGNLLESLEISKLGFGYSEGTGEYRFDIDAKANFKNIGIDDLFSFDELHFQNIGLKFNLKGVKLPDIKFDLSKLIVLPKIDFTGKGLLRSFPIRFSHFRGFKFKKKLEGGKPDFDFTGSDFDFFKLPKFNCPDIDFNIDATLFSFVFDFDLGSLGNLEALKALKGQFLLGWSFKGGFAIGFKFSGPSQGLHVDFGAIKLDIKEVNLCSFEYESVKSYYLRLVNARLTIFGKELPNPKDFDFNGIIYANPFGDKKSSKVAWFIAATKGNEDPNKEKLILGFGQRVGVDKNEVSSVQDGIDGIKKVFQTKIDKCEDFSGSEPVKTFYHPDRDFLFGTEAILPQDWGITFKAIFNDPVLYGARFGIDSIGFELEILYKRLSENLGVYSVEIQLPDAIRSYDTGAAYFRLPNIGIDVYTNGDWKVDIGFPRGDNWSRSGFLQLRTVPPFVGWFGFYLMQSKVASLTLFKGYIDDSYSAGNLNIIQAGFALRVGLGAYIDGGVFYIGASITVYGILEGAFAFKKEKGLAKFFPNHFAVLGRVGAIAEVVVYVDFFIIQARADFRLQVEFGMLLVYLSEPGSVINPGKPNQSAGIQPVKVYVEGRVVIRLSVKIGCIRFHLSFEKTIRFEYTIGGGGDSNRLMFKRSALLPDFSREIQTLDIVIKNIKDVPMAYMPGYSKVNEGDGEKLLMIHSFFIPFFGKDGSEEHTNFTKKNIIKTSIIKPFFEDLISQLKEKGVKDADSYETLRSILLNIPDFEYKANISVPNYTPTFISGINSETKDDIKKILNKLFLFEDDEIHPCDMSGTCQPIVETYKDSLKILQAPVSTNIKIVDKDNNVLFSTETGFKLIVESLVNNETGTSSTIASDILPVLKSDADIENMGMFYDDYKTQFIERSKNNRLQKLAGIPKDIRKNVVAPEFFKLLALLTLEAFFDTINPKDKKGEKINPVIEIDPKDGHFNYTYTIKNEKSEKETISGKWDPNKAIEVNKIIEQLNYFYNSGLRIPDNAGSITTTSLYEILKQQEIITPFAGGDWKKVKISIDNFDITNDVFGATEAAREKNIAGEKGMWKYIDGFKDPAFLSNLKKEFDPSGFKFVKPFELVPVTLAVQTGKLNVGNPVESKFFELPAKLALHSKSGSAYSFAINYANAEKQESGKDVIEYSTAENVGASAKLSVDPCLNIEIKVRKQAARVVEIVNVFVDDLNLAFAMRNTLATDQAVVKAINFYYKPEETDPDKNITLVNLAKARATILKTNLSPRTFPPVISGESFFAAKKQDDQRKYIADSDDTNKANFANLLWEALTTNNGGYSLVFDKELPDLGETEKTIIVSFEVPLNDNSIPKYFNCFKLNKKPGYKEIFETGLNDKKHYLFIDHLCINGKEVKEFHPTIPAHTFGFQVLRNRVNGSLENTSQYLPLEFNLEQKGGAEILNRNKVLPVMPTTPEKDDNILQYKHVSPLVNKNSQPDPKLKNDIHNICNRYFAIGKTYKLDYGLRDTYGFRTSGKDDSPINSKEYQHFYLDKIVPVTSWPFIKFSYWLNDLSTPNKLIFDLRVSCSLLEILDAAGIERKADGKYKYQLGEEISEADKDKIFDGISNSMQMLYTICAQLFDEKAEVEISFWNDTAKQKAKDELLKKVLHLVDILEKIFVPARGRYYMPAAESPLIFQLEVATGNDLKQELNIFINIKRQRPFALDAANAGIQFGYDPEELKDDNLVWDFSNTYKSNSKIRLADPAADAGTSTIAELNKVIRAKTVKKYALGISSNEETKEKVIYLVNEGNLSAIAVNKSDLKANKFDKDKCYFGIKPFSNKLWSGNYEYEPEIGPGQSENFSNIDLDKALKIVLAKVDDLLKSQKLSTDLNNPQSPVNQARLRDLYEHLVAAKKWIVENQLKDKTDWVMSDPAGNIGEQKSEIIQKMKIMLIRLGAEAFMEDDIAEDLYSGIKDSVFSPAIMIKEFRSLLLAGLDNFYIYDGIIKTSLTGLEILNADPGNKHRLTIGLKYDETNDPDNKNYNLFSSKVGYENGTEWIIFFDQKDNIDTDITFSVQPEITHIEFDIKPEIDEIEHATWIQLISPVKLTDNGGKYKVEKWEKITRSFPEKPVITRHEATQQFPDLKEWKIQDIGKWYYELEINDAYRTGDMVYAELILETSLVRSLGAEGKNFNAFIAFWSSKISKEGSTFKWEDFVYDFSKQFSQVFFTTDRSAVSKRPYFELKKTGPKKWEITRISDVLKPHLKLKESVLGVTIENLDIFSTDSTVYSVNPEIRVLRNKGVNNPGFWYETEMVKPVTPAVPHIKYFNPLQLQNSVTAFEKLVFEKLNTMPFKATAKYLVNTDKEFPNENHYELPIIPVMQIESKQFDASQTATDKLFDHYQNGYAAFSLTVYNNKIAEGADVPIFHAETIIKK